MNNQDDLLVYLRDEVQPAIVTMFKFFANVSWIIGAILLAHVVHHW